ncbi:MAG: hypothetical protein CMJ48_01225 [Planctomycetaceae bacterium]|nr:hypothetical protein [Planctomycetaceae bacterium]
MWSRVILGVAGLAVVCGTDCAISADERMTSRELAQWIDARFSRQWKAESLQPPPLVDDATFMRRAYLDLIGSVPSVPQVLDFTTSDRSFKREALIEQLLSDDRRPEQYADHSARHLARIWRRAMIPKSSPGAASARQFDPWLETQFAENVPYDEFARRILTTPVSAGRPQRPGVARPAATPAIYLRAVGGTPVVIADASARFFLGVRIGCAQCHNHPFSDWTQEDLWGMAAFFSNSQTNGQLPRINDGERQTYVARFLWQGKPVITAEQSPRDVLANWMVSAENPNFSATAVNRIWQHLCGGGLVESVDDLEDVSPEERAVLDELARLFTNAGFDTRWLISGICQSRYYRRVSIAVNGGIGTSLRPLKTLTPEQMFDSLEQVLSLPIGQIDNGPRYNGLREAFVARMDEAAGESPDEFLAGIPQALMIMNGKVTATATDLETSRTLRAVVDAPFLRPEKKIEILYLAAFTRPPTEKELKFLQTHLDSQKDDESREKAYGSIFWSLLNSPEFVLSR